MSTTSKNKTNVLWMFFTAIFFIFRETNKQISLRENLTKHKRSCFELSVIENNSDIMRLKHNKTIMFVDYRRSQSHIRLFEQLLTKANVTILYIDTLEKAQLANKLGFRNTNTLYLFDKQKYFNDIKTSLEREITRINTIENQSLRTKLLRNIRKRIRTGKFSKYDEMYHFKNIELLIYYKIKFIHNVVDRFFLNNNSSMLLFSFLISNIINSLFFLIK